MKRVATQPKPQRTVSLAELDTFEKRSRQSKQLIGAKAAPEYLPASTRGARDYLPESQPVKLLPRQRALAAGTAIV